jgi:GTP-binding protein HflX
MSKVTGNTSGLKPSQLAALERLGRRAIAAHQVVSPELATTMAQVSRELERQIGLMVGRQGDIEHVIVGDSHKLFLPDVGRLRVGRGHFRGLRLVHTHLRGEPLTRDDLTDLALLRLDLVAALQVLPDGRPGVLRMAHLLPENPEGAMTAELPARDVHHLDRELHFGEFIAALEDEFRKKTARARHKSGRTRALLVQVAIGRRHDTAARLAELHELCRTAGVEVVGVSQQKRPEADPKYLVGRGKLEDVIGRAMQSEAEVLIFDPDLTPAQARAISDHTEMKVIDRTMLILDIFAQHAQSRDGKLQVELAQLKYTLPRLVEKNTMMSRLTGGIGGRGPGETKLEINRRRARERLERLEKEIEALGERRLERRKRRTHARASGRDLPIIAIVGYTNAGKSTLLNSLTQGAVLAENKLFATLDPTSRRLRFPREREVILTDTVGFIRDLPADLVNAFRATLEELADADLLLHVIDIADDDHVEHVAAVERILGELQLGNTPRLLVANKIDRLDPEVAADRARALGAIPTSAQDPKATIELLVAMERALWMDLLPTSGKASGSAELGPTSSSGPP